MILEVAVLDMKPGEGEAGGPLQWRTLVSGDRTPSEKLTAGIAELAPGESREAPHQHAQPELYCILCGEGVVEIDGEEHAVREGSAVFIPGDARHCARNTGRELLRLLYVFPCDAFEEVEYRW